MVAGPAAGRWRVVRRIGGRHHPGKRDDSALGFLGHEDSEFARRCAAYLVEKQLATGGWAMYPGGGVEVSGSVKAYFALKLTGHDAGAEYMQRAREAILAHGGADAVNSFTRFYLALLGQIGYEQCPAVPPELVLLPKWFPVNLYAFSSWTRTIVVPLSIISALRPVRRLEPRLGIRELFIEEPEKWPALRCPGLTGGTGFLSWDHFFRTIDRLLKWCQRRRLLPWRRKALAAAQQWMIARFDQSDGLGAIYPPMVWSIVALKCLGYPDDSPEVQYCQRQLQDLVWTISTRARPGFSPASRPSGIRRLWFGHWRKRCAARKRGNAPRPWSGCGRGRSAGGATGRKRSMPSRVDGASSSPTTSTPIATIRPWPCWHCRRSLPLRRLPAFGRPRKGSRPVWPPGARRSSATRRRAGRNRAVDRAGAPLAAGHAESTMAAGGHSIATTTDSSSAMCPSPTTTR